MFASVRYFDSPDATFQPSRSDVSSEQPVIEEPDLYKLVGDYLYGFDLTSLVSP